jgi:hypothetical protein
MKFARRVALIGSLMVPVTALTIAPICAQTVQPPGPSPAVPSTPPGCPDASGRDAKNLSQSCGVIIPPQTADPSVKSPPNQGAMPVIPPPGTPGGDPTVLPK